MLTEQQRRVAERILVVPEIDAMLADTPGRIGEIATLGCRFEHGPRLAIGTTMALRFAWEGQTIALNTKIVYSELKLVGDGKFYHSGLQFGDADPAQREKIRTALGKHLSRVLLALFPDLPLTAKPRPLPAAVPFMSTPFMSAPAAPAPSAVASGYLEFCLRGGQWTQLETPTLSQPRDGLSFPADWDADTIDRWRRCFESAEEPVRRMIRAALELRIGGGGELLVVSF